MTSITAQQLIREVRKRAQENPNFIYPGDQGDRCVYVATDTKPSCIIGVALLNLGMPESLLETYEGSGVYDILWGEGYNPSQADDRWLSDVQSSQDNGIPWGQAVAEADNAV